jgi:type I restriction enzyme S subunit
MPYKAFPQYRDTDIPWMRDIPAHWSIKPLKVVSTCNDETLPEITDPDYEFDYVDISSVSLVDGIRQRERMTFEKAPSRARRVVRHGDSLVSTVRTYLKAVATIDHEVSDLVVSTGFAVLRPGKEMRPKYLGYFVQTHGFVDTVVARSTGVSYPAILASELVTIPAPIPPTPEQEAISGFLDRETALIDALIDRKRRLLDLIEEKRLAIITHAVTKGLNADAPMKDSGIDWLGLVPKHWEVMRLRFVMARIEQGWSPQCNNYGADDDEWGVLKVGCVNGSSFDHCENKALPEDLEPRPQYEIGAGDILMSRANTKQLLGSVAIVNSVRPKLLLCDKLYRLIVSDLIDRQFAVLALRSHAARFQYERSATGTSGSMQNIGQDTIKDVVIGLPPLPEQADIARSILAQSQKLTLAGFSIAASIKRHLEYRSALITNAVTGKIDVRYEAEKGAAS